MSGTWASDWALNDTVTVAEFRKGMGCVADSTLGIATASFDFTGLPTTYAHLRIVAMLRGDVVAATTTITLRVNNDSGANYDYEIVAGQAAVAPTSVTGVAQTSFAGLNIPGASATASYPGVVIVDIPAYAGTTFFKSMVAANGYLGTTASTSAGVASCWWRNTAAINRVTIAPGTGNFVTGSRCSIYVMGS